MLAAALAIAGCASVRRASNAYEEVFAPLEGQQSAERRVQGASLSEVARGDCAWHAYELGRRLELGLGVARDAACAAFWYARADQMVYAFEDWSGPLRPNVYNRTGIAKARIALRRLAKQGVDMDTAALDQLATRCTESRASLGS